MTTPQQIIDIIDAGLARPNVWTDKINQTFCGRSNCNRTPVLSHDFCPDCLAWLRGESDVDPLLAGKKPAEVPTLEPAPFPPVVEDVDWEAYIEACTTTGWATGI